MYCPKNINEFEYSQLLVGYVSRWFWFVIIILLPFFNKELKEIHHSMHVKVRPIYVTYEMFLSTLSQEKEKKKLFQKQSAMVKLEAGKENQKRNKNMFTAHFGEAKTKFVLCMVKDNALFLT